MKYQWREVGQRIYFVRGHRVMLDSDLALLYEVKTFVLNQAVKRNKHRFPEDFIFQLTADELDRLILQTGIPKPSGRGGRRTLPYVFTQEGVAMLSSVLHSERALMVNVTIMRTFVKFREMLETNKDLAKKLDRLERKYDHQFKVVFDVIRKLMEVGSPLAQKRVKGLDRN